MRDILSNMGNDLSESTMRDERFTPIAEFLESWINSARAQLDFSQTARWLPKFDQDYRVLLSHAEHDLEELTVRLVALLGQLNRTTVAADELMYSYIDALSINVDNEQVFLPSFSDRCLRDVARLSASPGGLSPFRGLYYAWALGEAAYEFGLSQHLLHRRHPNEAQARQHRDVGFKKLRNLLEGDLAIRWSQQVRHTYASYQEELRSSNDLASTPSELRDEIAAVKVAFRQAMSHKWRWIHLIPYPCRSSTHFYLSGVRFYANPSVYDDGTEWSNDDRFAVNSTDSGITLPAERYGMLLPDADDFDFGSALLEMIPVGGLTLDLSTESATDVDCRNLRYFETWSRLITARAYSTVSEALNLCDYDRARNHGDRLDAQLAIGYFVTAVAKNPMRTFYFDSGLLAAAGRALQGGPKVQYVTTRRSCASRDPRDPARSMIEALFDIYGRGLDFYLTFDADWPSDREFLRRWTLIPLGGRLSHRTCSIWSERQAAIKKITHGHEGMLWQGLVKRSTEGFRSSREAALLGFGIATDIGVGLDNLALVPIPVAVHMLGQLYVRTSGQSKAEQNILESVQQPLRFSDRIQGSADERLYRPLE